MDRFGIRPRGRLRAADGRARQRADGVHDGRLAARAVLGRPGRRRRRLDVDGVRRDRGEPLVRRPPRPRGGRAHRRQRDRAAALPAARRLAGDPPRLAHRRADHRRGRAGRRTARRAASCATTRPTWACRPYGATDADPGPPPHQPVGSSAGRALRVLRDAARVPTFWLLAGGFAICGATTNGLIATHFIPAAMDHGMPPTTAAGLLAVVGIFDVGGTIASGWFTDRVDPRMLLLAYYALRGVGAGRAPVVAVAAHDARHLGLHHLLRARLGGHGAADGDALPRLVRRRGRVDRVRLGLRLPPGRGGVRGVRRGGGPRPDRAPTTRRSTPPPASASSPRCSRSASGGGTAADVSSPPRGSPPSPRVLRRGTVAAAAMIGRDGRRQT